jgi:ketosteroid isomerase-like protein
MDDTICKELEEIEDLHRRDVAATKAEDFEALKSLMDEECLVFPPDGEPESGKNYLDGIRALADGSESHSMILELTQDWEEIIVLGDFAYEQGVVRYSVSMEDGSSFRETQRLMRILRRQRDGVWRVFRAMWHAPSLASDGPSGGSVT